MFGRSALQFGLTTALAALAVPFVGPDLRAGFAYGVGTAALAGGLTLGFLALTSKKDGKQLLAGFVASFLLKMLLVAAGMLLAHLAGASLVGFSLGFFALLIVHQGLEILLVTRLAKVPKAEGRA